MPQAPSTFVLSLALASALLGAGCASTGQFVWYSQLPGNAWSPPPGAYVINIGDTIDVRVYDQENMSLRGKVRSDGRFSLPFVGDVVVAGKTPPQLASEVEARLKEFIVTPRVTVNVEESVPVVVSVLGEVRSRGTVSLAAPATLVQVLAQAGGLTEFADDDSIYVLRRAPKFERIRFTYDALSRNLGGAATFPVHSGDIVVAE